MRGFQREGEKKEIRGMWFEISRTTWYAGIFIIT